MGADPGTHLAPPWGQRLASKRGRGRARAERAEETANLSPWSSSKREKDSMTQLSAKSSTNTSAAMEHFKLVFGSGNSDLAKIRPLKVWTSWISPWVPPYGILPQRARRGARGGQTARREADERVLRER